MTEDEALIKAAEKYRAEGYAVVTNPDPSALPAELRGRTPGLLATRNGTAVVVEVWSRDRINDLPPPVLPTGWTFDVVVLPRAHEDGPEAGPPATPESTLRLLTELEDLVPRGAYRARFLLAWSAAESAMRVAAERVDVDPQRLPPRQLITELVSAGVISHDQRDRLVRRMAKRNQLAHGVPVEVGDPVAVDELAALARELIAEKAVPVG